MHTLRLGYVFRCAVFLGGNLAVLRVLEAQKLGFTKCILPFANLDGLSDIPEKMRIVGVSNVADAINELI